MGRIDRRPLQAFLAALLLMCLASPAAFSDETLRYPVHDPKTLKPGSLLASVDVLVSEDESGDAEDIRRVRQAIRDRLDAQELNQSRNEAAIFILSWDTILSSKLTRVALERFADKRPQYRDALRKAEPNMVMWTDRAESFELPLSVAFFYGLENLKRADGRLRTVEGRLALPARVTLRGHGDCELAEGTFNVARRGHMVELSNDEYATYLGTTTDQELWLHLNEQRWAQATIGEYINISAPERYGQLFALTPMITPEGQGFAGSQWQKPDCRVEIRPSSP